MWILRGLRERCPIFLDYYRLFPLVIRPGQKLANPVLGEVPQTRCSGPVHKNSVLICLIPTARKFRFRFAMRKSSNENGDHRPTLPSIWDLFRDELSEPSSAYNIQASSSARPLSSGRDRRYDGWVPNHLANQDHSSIFSDSLSTREVPTSVQHHQAPYTSGPAFYPALIPRPYSSPRETQGGPNPHHNLGADQIPPYRRSTPGPAVDHLPSADSQGRFSQTTRFSTSADVQPGADERTPGASYSTFRLFQPSSGSQTQDENARYECHYCGKAFNRPSTLRIHLNSHTGERPFLCPVEGCGRSFSVLSNMRRHARVHSQPTTPEGTAQLSGEGTPSRDRRQINLASSSSVASQNNYNNSSEDDSDEPDRYE